MLETKSMIEIRTLDNEKFLINPEHITMIKEHPNHKKPVCLVIRLSCGKELFCPLAFLPRK